MACKEEDENYMIQLKEWMRSGYYWQKSQEALNHWSTLQQLAYFNAQRIILNHSNTSNTSNIATTTAESGSSPNNSSQNETRIENNANYVTYSTAKLWKRVCAEIFDFVLFLSVKIILLLALFENYDDLLYQVLLSFRELRNLDVLENQLENFPDGLTIATLFKIDSDQLSYLMFWTTLYRIVICLYEATFLSWPLLNFSGRCGAATPGKALFGIYVIGADQILSLPEDRIDVQQPYTLSFWSAFLRAFMKNFSMSFLFPACFTVFVFEHYRAVYDIICSSVVVEMISRRPRNAEF